MFDVLTYLFEEYNDPAACPERKELMRQLTSVGFENEEITDALDWLEGLAPPSQSLLDQSHGMRFYSDEERTKMGVEICGLLLFLEENEAFGPALRELIIDRLMALEEEDLTPETAKLVVLLVLWSQQAELPILVGEELLVAIHGELTMQ